MSTDINSSVNNASIVNAGLDFGSASVNLAATWSSAEDSSSFLISQPTMGRPISTGIALLQELKKHVGDCPQIRLVVTGAGKDVLQTSGIQTMNEVVTAAAGAVHYCPKAGTIIDLGGQFSKCIRLAPDEALTAHITDVSLNGLCAAGAGIFLEQQASRLNMSVQELGKLALEASSGVPIAGRCSVFAKSDMIHQQQKGTPVAEIAYGVCLALARTFAGTVLRGIPVSPPVVFIGGGAANAGLVRALCEVLRLSPTDYVIPSHPMYVGALGAMLSAKGNSRTLASVISSLKRCDGSAASAVSLSLAPLARSERDERGDFEGHNQPAESIKSDSPVKSVNVHLGIDIGSVSTNVVMLDDAHRLIERIYVPTRGNPVSALNTAFQMIPIERRNTVHVLSAGATGSGRHLAERIVGVDTVRNEITAQLASAVHVCPDVDTVFEIGGQDSKFIRTANGRILDFEMNKICAAGTGSFLEEQAERLAVSIKGEFSHLALQSTCPTDLGSKCTVFMDAALCRAQSRQARLTDLCAGLAYSVARNYLEKVVAERDIGQRVLFQGGTSQNHAVRLAFETLLNRPIDVHPNGDVSGAIGAALLAARECQGAPSGFFGFDACNDVTTKRFECKSCSNRCTVNQVKAMGCTAHFGDVCEKFSARDNASGKMVARTANRGSLTNWFKERHNLMQTFLSSDTHGGTGSRRIGLLRATLSLELLPFWYHFVLQLGFVPVVSKTEFAAASQTTGHDFCLPLKRAAGQAAQLLEDDAADVVLVPSLQHLPPRQSGDRANTCLYTQFLPDMIKATLRERVLTPMMSMSAKKEHIFEAASALAKVLQVSRQSARRAWQKATAFQQRFNEERLALGQRALNSVKDFAVVVIGKPYNLHDEQVNLNLSRHLYNAGIPAIPMDLFPLNDTPLPDSWQLLPWTLNRDQARALQIAAAAANLFPIHVSCYGCGPDAFAIKHLEKAWGDRPGLFLEFDEHRGEAGLITRIEAFKDEIKDYLSQNRQTMHLRHPSSVNAPRPSQSLTAHKLFLPYTTPHVHIYSAVLHRIGFRTETLPYPDQQSIQLGEQVSSGRECHPFSIIAGDLIKLVKSNKWKNGDHCFLPATRLPCLLSQYGDGLRKTLRDIGNESLKIFDPHPGELHRLTGAKNTIKLYEGLSAVDMLIAASCRYRPFEKNFGEVDRRMQQCLTMLEECIEADGNLKGCFADCIAYLTSAPRHEWVPRPVVGVTGDLYTRLNTTGNSRLFYRLEEMGCVVWPSPFYAASIDFELPQDAKRFWARKEYRNAVKDGMSASLLRTRSNRIASVLPKYLKDWCKEPDFPVLQKQSQKYVNENTNHLIRGIVAKMADFASKDVDGIVNAIGVGCMAGISAASIIPQIRDDFDQLPIISMAFDGKDSPSEAIQLETFVHQVKQRFDYFTLQSPGQSPGNLVANNET